MMVFGCWFGGFGWVVCVVFDLGFGVFVLGGWKVLLFVICFVFVWFVCLFVEWLGLWVFGWYVVD